MPLHWTFKSHDSFTSWLICWIYCISFFINMPTSPFRLFGVFPAFYAIITNVHKNSCMETQLEREEREMHLRKGAAVLCIYTEGVTSPLVKWPLPSAHTHTHTLWQKHTHTVSERERGSAAGPLRAEPRSHSLQRGREKRRDRGSERERERGCEAESVWVERERGTQKEREREPAVCVRGWRITSIPSCFGETNLVHLSIVGLFYVVVVEGDGPLLQHAHWAWATSGV